MRDGFFHFHYIIFNMTYLYYYISNLELRVFKEKLYFLVLLLKYV